MAAETLRTDRVRNDKEAREGPPTLSIGISRQKASCEQVGSRLTKPNICYVAPKPSPQPVTWLAGTFRSRGCFP
jgi:hypothetical protein